MGCSVIFLLTFLLVSSWSHADSGLVSVKSAHNVKKIADRLESVLKAKGMRVFTRFDHPKGAKSVDKSLRPVIRSLF